MAIKKISILFDYLIFFYIFKTFVKGLIIFIVKVNKDKGKYSKLSKKIAKTKNTKNIKNYSKISNKNQ